MKKKSDIFIAKMMTKKQENNKKAKDQNTRLKDLGKRIRLSVVSTWAISTQERTIRKGKCAAEAKSGLLKKKTNRKRGVSFLSTSRQRESVNKNK